MQGTLHKSSSILVTGTTGLIGGEVLARLLSEDVKQIWALIRPTRHQSALERLQGRLAETTAGTVTSPIVVPGHVSALEGDITQPRWGLNDADYQDIVNHVDIIIHNAADTSFAPNRRPEDTNITSVQRLIELARSCRKAPLIVYMSTASNVGEVHNACLSEEDGCRPGNDHFNSYTQSKAVGEQLLRDSGLPILALRPTIVLSAGLTNQRFASQILWCLPVTRLFRALPLDVHARVDLVDVGFVADATIALLKKTNRGYDCYHLSAGPRHAVSLGQMSQLMDEHYGRRPLQLVPPEKWTNDHQERYVHNRLQVVMYNSLKYYLPFLNMDVVYDARRLQRELGADCPQVRPAEEYLLDLVDIISAKTAIREAALP
jgi:thioester reductase-like protein